VNGSVVLPTGASARRPRRRHLEADDPLASDATRMRLALRRPPPTACRPAGRRRSTVDPEFQMLHPSASSPPSAKKSAWTVSTEAMTRKRRAAKETRGSSSPRCPLDRCRDREVDIWEAKMKAPSTPSANRPSSRRSFSLFDAYRSCDRPAQNVPSHRGRKQRNPPCAWWPLPPEDTCRASPEPGTRGRSGADHVSPASIPSWPCSEEAHEEKRNRAQSSRNNGLAIRFIEGSPCALFPRELFGRGATRIL